MMKTSHLRIVSQLLAQRRHLKTVLAQPVPSTQPVPVGMELRGIFGRDYAIERKRHDDLVDYAEKDFAKRGIQLIDARLQQLGVTCDDEPVTVCAMQATPGGANRDYRGER
jgi:hypothetical protein